MAPLTLSLGTLLIALREIGYAISEAYWNKGFVTEAAEKVIAFGFEEMDLVRIQARCFVENAASEKVMKKSVCLMKEQFEKPCLLKELIKT